jgi:hypothetical protein
VAPGPARAPAGAGRPSEEAIARAARAALARVQTARATWTRADYLKHLGLSMPAESRDMEPAAAVELLHETATRALAGKFEDVIPMSAPEWPALPDYLVRELDGRSVYTRPGSERYATRVQLTLEERLIREAERQSGPRLARAGAAAPIGADADELDVQLRAKAQDARAGATGSGLRLDQGPALYHVLTSPGAADIPQLSSSGRSRPRYLSVLVFRCGSGQNRLPFCSQNRTSEKREPRPLSRPGLLTWEFLGVSEGIRTPDIQDHNLAL